MLSWSNPGKELMKCADLWVHDLRYVSYHIDEVLQSKIPYYELDGVDIGLLSNYHTGLMYDESISDEKKDFEFNIESDHRLFVLDENSVWLYVNQHGSVRFKITNNYPWHDEDPKEGEEYLPYKDWLASCE